MTKEMIILYEKLITVQVRSLAAAYSYLTEEINVLISKGNLSLEMDKEAHKKVNKGFKTLKKILKGKIEGSPDDVLKMFDEDTNEYFFLECLVRLVDINQLKK